MQFGPGFLEIVGRVVSRSRSGVSNERTARERRKQKSCRKAPVPLNELVMFVTVEKPQDKDEVQNCIGIVLGFVDDSDEVVVVTIDRVVEVHIVCRVPEGQRGDAGDAKSVIGVLWQPNSAETAEGELVSMSCVVSFQLTGTVREPREDKARCFDSGREVEVAKCGFSEDCEAWTVAASRDEFSRFLGKECRECIRVARMCDDAGGGEARASSVGRKS